MKKRILALLIFFLSVNLGYSQSQLLDVHFTLGFPVSNLADHIDVVSPRGLGADYRLFIDDNLTFGIGVSMSSFCNNLPSDSYTFDTITVSGIQYHYYTSIPIHAYCTYYLGMEEAPIRPYAGMGIGATMNRKRTVVRDFEIEQKGWQFSLQPELGMLFKATDYSSLMLSGRFNYPFNSSEIDSHPYFSLNVGLSFGIK